MYRRIKVYLYGLSLVALSTANHSHAQQDDIAYLEMNLEELVDVPVTGSTLTKESLKTVPAAVSVFTREHINRLGVDYLYELLNLVPGFQFNRNASSGVAYTYSARGRRTNQQSVEVLLLVDGHVVNDPRAGSPDIVLPLYPLSQVERVEIIRGPGSAIYGSSAFTGVINIITQKTQRSVAVQLGSQQRRQVENFWAASIGDWAFDSFIQAYRDEGDNYLLADTFSGHPMETRDPRQQLVVDLGLNRAQTRIALAFYGTETDDFYQSENTANNYNSSERYLWHVAMDQGFDWLPNTRSNLALGYQQFFYDFNLYLTGPGMLLRASQPSSAEPFKGDGRLAGESWRLTFSNDWTINHLSSAQWGLQVARNKETNASATGNFDLAQLTQGKFPITYYGEPGREFPLGTGDAQNNLGIYAQYLRDLRATTRLTLGGRFDEYPDITGRFSPRLGLVEQLNSSLSLKLLYGEAFRAPTLTETGLLNNPLLFGNPKLTHEIVKTWDLILVGNWNTTNASLGLFQNRYQGPIETVFSSGARTYANGEKQKSHGVELELLQQISSEWSLSANYTHMQLPDSAFREAEHLASTELNYSTARWNWNLAGIYQGHRQSPQTDMLRNRLDNFWLFNTELRYTFLGGHDLRLQIKNLTGNNYPTPSQGLGKPQGIPNRDRELSVAWQWKW